MEENNNQVFGASIMIGKLIKEHRPDIYKMVESNKYTRPLLKQLDVIWKKIEALLAKELKSKLAK